MSFLVGLALFGATIVGGCVLIATHRPRYQRVLGGAVLTVCAVATTFVGSVVAMMSVGAIPFITQTPTAVWAWPLVWGLTLSAALFGVVVTVRLGLVSRPEVSQAIPDFVNN